MNQRTTKEISSLAGRSNIFRVFLSLIVAQVCIMGILIRNAPESVQNLRDLGYPADFSEHNNENTPYAVFINTAHRKGGAFYLDKTLEGLHKAGVPAHAVTVFNVEGSAYFPELDAFRQGRFYQQDYPVRIVHSRKPGSFPTLEAFSKDPDKLKDRMHDFSFLVKSTAEMSHHFFTDAQQDTTERTYWRIKQNDDFLHSTRNMLYYYQTQKWFLFLEDDQLYAPLTKGIPENTLGKMLQGSSLQKRESKGQAIVFLAEGMRAQAILMQRQMLESFMGFVGLRFDYFPIDWLIETFLDSIGYVEEKRKTFALFQHMGEVSSVANDADRSEYTYDSAYTTHK
jgi:hypothetical protein